MTGNILNLVGTMWKGVNSVGLIGAAAYDRYEIEKIKFNMNNYSY